MVLTPDREMGHGLIHDSMVTSQHPRQPIPCHRTFLGVEEGDGRLDTARRPVPALHLQLAHQDLSESRQVTLDHAWNLGRNLPCFLLTGAEIVQEAVEHDYARAVASRLEPPCQLEGDTTAERMADQLIRPLRLAPLDR